MESSFARTLRSLDRDRRPGWARFLVPAALLLALWGAWFARARIAVYEVSDEARLEADREARPVEAPVDGRVVALHLTLGQEVAAGSVLAELEAGEQRFRLDEEVAQGEALVRQLAALQRRRQVASQGLDHARRAGVAAVAEAAARAREAESAAALAARQAARQEMLYASGAVAETDLVQARAAAEQRREMASAQALALQRAEWDRRGAEDDQRGRLEDVERQLALVRGQLDTAAATRRRLGNDLGLRTLRAPVTGRVDQLESVRVGSVVSEGDRLAVIIPRGDLRVVAEFAVTAVGRIRPGQRAWLRLAGFPSTQYGAVAARVARVASEAASNRIRVELAVAGGGASLPPLQHGLPGTCEVEVERVAPAVLVLRTMGRLLGRAAMVGAPPPHGAAGAGP